MADGRSRERWDIRWSATRAGQAALATLALAAVADLASEYAAGLYAHVAVEATVLVVVFGAVLVLTRHRSADVRAITPSPGVSSPDARAGQRDAGGSADGLERDVPVTIEQQFGRWGLSQAEREVAWLLLKGRSHREIAARRGTTQRTVRQQALAVYRKAALTGRAELAAYFLESAARAAPPRFPATSAMPLQQGVSPNMGDAH